MVTKNSETVSPVALPLDPSDEQLNRASQDVCLLYIYICVCACVCVSHFRDIFVFLARNNLTVFFF